MIADKKENIEEERLYLDESPTTIYAFLKLKTYSGDKFSCLTRVVSCIIVCRPH